MGDPMKDLKMYSTEEIVEELKYREGVEVFVIAPEWRCEVYIENEYDKTVYDARRQGPEIVLRIID